MNKFEKIYTEIYEILNCITSCRPKEARRNTKIESDK